MRRKKPEYSPEVQATRDKAAKEAQERKAKEREAAKQKAKLLFYKGALATAKTIEGSKKVAKGAVKTGKTVYKTGKKVVVAADKLTNDIGSWAERHDGSGNGKRKSTAAKKRTVAKPKVTKSKTVVTKRRPKPKTRQSTAPPVRRRRVKRKVVRR
ncbi:MAG: hypothetical protein M0R51_05120 [Clostridia bacterium]|nr:hypothetical protein [Clostridia bacterium]